MKELNNKGFTLIELLAVIVILAIIMVVTIPTVLNSMGNARKQTFQTSANTVADWVEKEYALAQLDMADSAFTGVCNNSDLDNLMTSNKKAGNGAGYCSTNPYNSAYMVSGVTSSVSGYQTKISGYTKNASNTTALNNMLKAAGVDPDNYGFVRIKITNGRACVTLGASDSGQFKQFIMTTANYNDVNAAKSTGC